MSRAFPMLWRLVALVVVVVALAAVLSACGSSSGGSSTGESAGGPVTNSVAEEVGEEEAEGEGSEGESAESELEGIIRIEIYGKFGGTPHEYDLVEGGTCKIVKINVSPAAVKADHGAVLDHEGNASVEVAPLKSPATMRHCREAAESAIG